MRPKRFFSEDGSMPAAEVLHVTTPPGFATEAFRTELTAAVATIEERAQRELGGGSLGRARVLAQRPTAGPPPGEPRRGLNPRVACRDKWKRIEVLGRLREFLNAYRAAWAAWCAGDPQVWFPAGTPRLRVLHGAPCAGVG